MQFFCHMRLALILLAVPGFAGPLWAAGAPQALAPGAYVIYGDQGEPSPQNRGAVSNLAFVAGEGGVVAIGTGTSTAAAQAFLRSIQAAAGKPVKLALNTQASADHVLGNGEFARRGIPILAHRDTDHFMVQNCERCIHNLELQAGKAAMAGTRMARPDRLVEGGTTLDIIGRPLEILHFGATYQAGSLALLDRERGVLFAGEMLSIGRLPDVHNADIRNWLAALEKIRRLPVKWVVPAHGPAVPPERVEEMAVYLRQLLAGVERAYGEGVPMQEAVRSVAVAACRDWALFDSQHPRNVHHTYLKVEAEDLGR